MQSLFHSHSPFRIFAFSTIASIAVLIAVLWGFGREALLVTLMLVAIEITFSFDNAIINAKVLARMSTFWQNIFLSVGIIVAIFVVRLILPIGIVAITAGLAWKEVINLALNYPDLYAHELEAASPLITAFGGAFLMMLATSFFFDNHRSIHWFHIIEKPMQKIGSVWLPYVLTITVVVLLATLPANDHRNQTIIAGFFGIAVYFVVHILSQLFSRASGTKKNVTKQVGLAAFMSFLYLEVLDASFSLDGVIGAFAITNKVVLITAGLGIGAIWVRSLTIFMVRRGTLDSYRFMEHGAYYTISVLAAILLFDTIIHVPESIPGVVGIVIIFTSIFASKMHKTHLKHRRRAP